MGISINRVVLVGNLTRDPELRHTQGGTPVCGLSLAVNGREKVGDQWQDRADFFEIRVWDKQGEACSEHLAKGSPVAVSGRLRLDQWEKDGEKKRRVIVVADDVQFLSRGGGGNSDERSAAFVPEDSFNVPQDFGGGTGSDEFATGTADFPTGTDDDIPF